MGGKKNYIRVRSRIQKFKDFDDNHENKMIHYNMFMLCYSSNENLTMRTDLQLLVFLTLFAHFHYTISTSGKLAHLLLQ